MCGGSIGAALRLARKKITLTETQDVYNTHGVYSCFLLCSSALPAVWYVSRQRIKHQTNVRRQENVIFNNALIQKPFFLVLLTESF